MSSELDPETASTILETMMAALGEGTLAGEIDAPVDEVTDSLLAGSFPEASPAGLQSVVVELIRQVYAHGVAFRRDLSDYDALAQGAAILSSDYDAPGTGWYAALADVSAGNTDAYEAVVICLGKGVKTREREAYRNWVLACGIRGIDWDQRRSLARAFIHRFGHTLPQEVSALPLDAVADNLEELLLVQVEADRVLSDAVLQFVPHTPQA